MQLAPIHNGSDIEARPITTSEETTALVALFEKIAEEEGWQPNGQIEILVPHAVLFGLWAEGNLIGGLALVLPDPVTNRLPCHTVWPDVATPPRAAHIAVMAVEKAWRGRSGGKEFGSLFWELAVLMWRYCADNRITQLFLETTPRTRRCYERLGWPLEICGSLRPHWGEPCTLCLLDVREVAGSLTLRATRSAVYRRVLAQAIQPKR